MATDLYITNFNADNTYVGMLQWIHDHPDLVTAGQIGGSVFGAASIISAPYLIPAAGALISTGIILTGVVLLVASIATWFFLNYISCAAHDITQHAFEPAECEGGRLYYRGHVPILELTARTPRQAGEAHGFLLGSHIRALKTKYDLILHTFMQHARPEALPRVLAKMRETIPRKFLDEMEGLAEGYNRWAERAGVADRMTLDEVILIHLLPDSKHFLPETVEELLRVEGILAGAQATPILPREEPLGVPACTCILDRDPRAGLQFLRNMEWCPFGEGGTKTLVVVWKNTGEAALSMPGIVGAITGWNQAGLCVAMNVCPGFTGSASRGMPAILYNREILQRCQTTPQVELVASTQERPLGPYHLTVADAHGSGRCISFYQGQGESDHVRLLDSNSHPHSNGPLITLNWRYPECQGGIFNSPERNEILTRYYAGVPVDADRRKLAINAGKMSPYFNSWHTTHSLLFQPEYGSVELHWDNGFAASTPAQTLRMSELFE